MEITLALESLKATLELVVSAVDLIKPGQKVGEDLTQIRARLIDAQRQIIDAMETETQLLRQIDQLARDNTELRRRQSDESRYSLTQVSTGAFAYVGRPGDDPASPEVWLCQPCFERRQHAILQFKARTPDRDHSDYACPECDGRIRVRWTRAPGKPPSAPKTKAP